VSIEVLDLINDPLRELEHLSKLASADQIIRMDGMRSRRRARQKVTGELGAAKSCPPSSEGAGRRRTSAMKQRAALRPYIDGIEEVIAQKYTRNSRRGFYLPIIVRYADDLVAVHDDLNTIREVQELIEAQLKPMGLRLKPEKTRITHTLKSENGPPGFDFLGFNIRQYPVGKTHSGKTHQGQPLGFKTIIKPAKSSIRRQTKKLRETVAGRRYAEQQVLIKALMPVIVGWSRYYSTVVSKRIFNYLDMVLFSILLAWACRRHTGRRKDWIIRKYWSQAAGKLWTFQTPGGKQQLPGHSQTPIRRHIKVIGNRSIYDGNWVYWSTRLRRRPDVPARVSKLLQKQRGTCWECGLYFRDGDLMEMDHIIPRALGGKDAFHNLQLLHRHCHDRKTAEDNRAVGTNDNRQMIEEPCDSKGSSTVLKPSGGSDPVA
jgi:RNA-directed DNA polymerase